MTETRGSRATKKAPITSEVIILSVALRRPSTIAAAVTLAAEKSTAESTAQPKTLNPMSDIRAAATITAPAAMTQGV